MLKTTMTMAAVVATVTFVPGTAANAATWAHRGRHHASAQARFAAVHAYGHHGFTHHRAVAFRGDRQGRRRVVASSTAAPGGAQVGRASFYAGGGHTANGGFVGSATCAHRSLPFGTKVLVTNLANARQAVLTVNDRGPFVRGRLLDVSRGAAGLLGMLHAGVSQIRMQILNGAG